MVDQRKTLRRRRAVLLQTKKAPPGRVEKRPQPIRSDRPAPIHRRPGRHLLTRVARPHHADAGKPQRILRRVPRCAPPPAPRPAPPPPRRPPPPPPPPLWAGGGTPRGGRAPPPPWTRGTTGRTT